MEITNNYLNVVLKPNYFHEFILSGVPVPEYSNDSKFILRFKTEESYLNYQNTLKSILTALTLESSKNSNFEIHRGKAFIKHILNILEEQFSKKHNKSQLQKYQQHF